MLPESWNGDSGSPLEVNTMSDVELMARLREREERNRHAKLKYRGVAYNKK